MSHKRFSLVIDRETYGHFDYSMALEQLFHDHRMIIPRSWNNQNCWVRVLLSLYAYGNINV